MIVESLCSARINSGSILPSPRIHSVNELWNLVLFLSWNLPHVIREPKSS